MELVVDRRHHDVPADQGERGGVARLHAEICITEHTKAKGGTPKGAGCKRGGPA